MSNFKDYNLKSETQSFIEKNKFVDPTPIQAKVIPLAIKGKDIVGIAKTGTGKTHAFLIPIMEKIDLKLNTLQVVITAPTRELANQIFQRAKLMKEVFPDLRIVEAVGGTNRLAAKQSPHILIGTPGRILDLVNQQQIYRVDKVKMLIIDEADMTMEYGFLKEVDLVAGQMPKKLQMMVFGATIPKNIQPFLRKYMSSPLTISCEDHEFGPKIEHVLIACKQKSYVEQLLKILPGFQPYICLIFANTRSEAIACARTLKGSGYEVLEIHGDLQARQRRQALKRLNSQQHSYVVATDLAARGMDIEGISHVVSLGFPSDIDFYLHRAGRTGRNNKQGVCFALYKESDKNAIKSVQSRGVKFTYKTFQNNQWRIIPTKKKSKPADKWEIEIAKIVNKKETIVKPGYKKKKREEVLVLKNKKRREKIQESIKQINKEKNKRIQREKGDNQL